MMSQDNDSERRRSSGAGSRGGGGQRKGAPRRSSSKGGSFGGSSGSRDGRGRSGDARRGGSGDGAKSGDGGRRGQRSERSTGGRGGPRRDDDRSGGRRRDEDRDRGPREVPKGPDGWGRLARKGADSARREEGRDEPQEQHNIRPPEHDTERWERVVDKGRDGGARPRRSARVEIHLNDASLSGLTQPQRDRVERRLGDAAAAFRDDRFEDARKILATMSERHPSVPELHELLGLSLYRLGRWKLAVRELETFTSMSGSTEQHPILADSARALGRHNEVRRLWEELRHDDPDADVLTEGRIVMAGSLADQGDVAGAIRVLEHGPVRAKKPSEHHLRLWYTLADLYERAGDIQTARRGFERVAAVDPRFGDIPDRLRALG